jgi:hypothetical protein
LRVEGWKMVGGELRNEREMDGSRRREVEGEGEGRREGHSEERVPQRKKREDRDWEW